jgi:hypothetical protein
MTPIPQSPWTLAIAELLGLHLAALDSASQPADLLANLLPHRDSLPDGWLASFLAGTPVPGLSAPSNSNQLPKAPGLDSFLDSFGSLSQNGAQPNDSVDAADTATLCDSVLKAQENLQGAELETEIEEVAADKGYHANETIEQCDALRLRTYIPGPKLKHERTWTDKPAEFKRAVFENRRRMKRAKGKRLGRLRSERVERSFAHVCDSGGMRAVGSKAWST